MVPVNHAVSWGRAETGIVAFTNHANGQRVIERVFGAATRHERPVFPWA
jgi:hypothetical protein